jgi:hypothetical protein
MSVSVRKPKKLRLPCPFGVYREAIEATECILLCRNRAESSLARFPRDLVRFIAKMVYETRYSKIWLRTRKIQKNLHSLKRLRKQINDNPQDEEALEKNEMLLEKIEALSVYLDI